MAAISGWCAAAPRAAQARRCSRATACMCTGAPGLPNIWAASPPSWRGRAPATLMDSRDALAGLNAFTAVASAALPEREAACAGVRGGRNPAGRDDAETMLAHWAAALCALGGGAAGSAGLRPRSLAMRRHRRDGGSHLCFAAHRAAPCRATAARTYARPPVRAAALSCWARRTPEPDADEIAAGLALTGHFLLERVLAAARQATCRRARLAAGQRIAAQLRANQQLE